MAMMAMREVEKIVCNADFLSQDVGLEASWPRSMRSSQHDPKQGQTGTEGRTSHRCKYVVDGAKLFPVKAQQEKLHDLELKLRRVLGNRALG